MDGELEALEASLLAVPEIRTAMDELEMGHSHEGMALNADNQCLVCGLRDSLRTLLAINQWMVAQLETEDEGAEGYDVGTIVMSMVGSASDLAMLAKVCSLSASILNLVAARSAGMLLEVLQRGGEADG